MKEVDNVLIPAKTKISFAPGGNHAMLFGLDPSIEAGQILPLQFRFASGEQVSVEAIAKSATDGDMTPAHAVSGDKTTEDHDMSEHDMGGMDHAGH